MDKIGDSCSCLLGLFGIGVLVLFTLVFPIYAFITDRDGFGLPALFLLLPVFFFILINFLGLEDNKILYGIFYGSISIGAILFLRFIILYIHDLFVTDPQSGMAEVLAIPIAAVIYGVAIWLLPVDADKGSQKSTLIWAKFFTILIVSVVVYLIYR